MGGRKILSCHIDTRNGAYNNINDMVRSNESSMKKRCTECKMNDENAEPEEEIGATQSDDKGGSQEL